MVRRARVKTKIVKIRCPQQLLNELDKIVDAGHYLNRSAAIRDGMDYVIRLFPEIIKPRRRT